MKKIILILILLVFVIGCAQEKIIIENIGDNAEIIKKEGTYQGVDYESEDIKYKKDEQEFQGYFDPALKESFEWIAQNSENAVFLSWWDYGHMIRGYTGKDVIIYSPSKDILWSLASGTWDEEKGGKFSSKEKISDVAVALTTINSDKTKEIMEKYNADYVFVTTRDAASSFVLFRILGLEDFLDGDYKTNDKAKATILFRMIDKGVIEGFKLVYSDELVRIYKIENTI